jgi:hypothetical protein
MKEQYSELNEELLVLLFTIERICGAKVGGGEFKGRVEREFVDVRHIFSYIAIVHLAYTHKQVKLWMGFKSLSNITYALRRIRQFIEYDVPYRNRLYNIAIECGVMGLLKDVIKEVDG